MVSKYLGSSTSLKGLDGEQEEDISGLPAALSLLKKQIQASRITSIKDKLVRNGRKLQESTSQMSALARSREELHSIDHTENKNMLLSRTVSPLGKISGCDSGFVDKESIGTQEELSSSVIMFSNNSGGKFSIQLTKLPLVEKIPPYSTWIFLARNQRMADDQSVVGRRQIYYDQLGGETLICSDSDVEIAEPEEEKHDFSEGEDQILWKALHDYGTNPEVFDTLNQFLDATPSEILERYDTLLKKYQANDQLKGPSSPVDDESEKRLFFGRPLTAALDSFDNLFCRRCLIFDCRLHGCSESSVVPSEKQPVYIDTEDIGKPCGDYCYRLKSGAEAFFSVPSKFGTISKTSVEQAITTDQIDVQLNVTEGSDCNDGMIQVEPADGKSGKDESIDVLPPDVAPGSRHSFTVDRKMLVNNSGKRRILKPDDLLMGEPASNIALGITHKKQKTLSPDAVSADGENLLDVGHDFMAGLQHLNPIANVDIQLQGKVTVGELSGNLSKINIAPSNTNSAEEAKENIDFTQSPALGASNPCHGQTSQVWSTLEKDLFLKGLEIFGRSSCLIARNLLSGLKTCKEVSKYMLNDEVTVLKRSMLSNSYSENNATDPENLELEQPTRMRIWRRRGRTRKLKYTWKSAIHPSIRKRIADGKEQSRKYVPCGCQQMCGKQCPCHQNGTCCEKYCRCSKSCKNRFRGCHCAKSQCRSRQCPCFAVGRECDPDVCRNCWVSCGDGSLGEPPARGDGYQCGNMKLLLKQQQRILLGRSDVAGWGAFLKNPVNKNDYLGEYTGELISHKEADKRGKIYDRANSSFLFDLNDQCVLDAYRKGDKLKFANHSSNPNCYAKVMLVAGDHRVGIFAKEHIEASEELFYDYRYGPDQAPAWARKPEGSKRDDYPSSQSRRAHKVA